jgi:uncharacterized membrane protein YfcA
MDFGLLSWLIGLCAGVLLGFSKTGVPGVGMLVVLLMAHLFEGKLSVGALLPMLIVGDCFAVAYYKRHAQWRRLWGLFPAVIAGMIPGAWALHTIGDEHFKAILGALVLGLIALEIARRYFGWTEAPKHWSFVFAMGFLAGFATTVGNVAGPVISLYLLSQGLLKKEFIGTGAWYYLLINCGKVPIFWRLGLITSQTLTFDLCMIPAIVAGALLGVKLLPKIPQRIFDVLVFILSAVAALRLVLT